jgi:gluconate kinase
MTLPVLWICGPSGSGKSAVGWDVRARLAASGADVAYVDVDQLGMCFPEPDDDPWRTRLQARILARVIDGFAAEGATGVVVSGVTDSENGPHGDLITNAALTVVRLSADDASLRARLTGRGSADLIDRALLDARTLAGSGFADHVVDTTEADVAGVVDRVLAATGGWPRAAAPSGASPRTEPKEAPGVPVGHVLLLSGATGVGKSTIGFPVFLQSLGADVPTAYLDLDQLSFVPPATAPAPARVTARHAAAAWTEFRAVGARRLVAVGPVDDHATLAAYEAAFEPAEVTLVRLQADPEEHAARVLSRGAGGSWAQPGDPLRGLPEEQLREAAARAVADAAARNVTAPGDRLDTTDRTAWDIATELAGRWP